MKLIAFHPFRASLVCLELPLPGEVNLRKNTLILAPNQKFSDMCPEAFKIPTARIAISGEQPVFL